MLSTTNYEVSNGYFSETKTAVDTNVHCEHINPSSNPYRIQELAAVLNNYFSRNLVPLPRAVGCLGLRDSTTAIAVVLEDFIPCGVLGLVVDRSAFGS